jgi:nucleotide-binding universal stress UspA family protein
MQLITLLESLKGEVILFHMAINEAQPRASVLNQKKIEEIMLNNARQDCLQEMNELKSLNKNVKFSYEVIEAFSLKKVLENYAIHNNIDLIVMGTKGASGFEKIIIGSNTASVISYSSIPVICVPEHARFSKINQVVYATDLASIKMEVQSLMPLLRKLHATINILHVISPDTKKKINSEKLRRDLQTQLKYRNFTVHILLSNDLLSGIESYLLKVKTDLVIMFTHYPSFWEKIWGNSLTREMSFQNIIPLLSVHKKAVIDGKKLLSRQKPQIQ